MVELIASILTFTLFGIAGGGGSSSGGGGGGGGGSSFSGGSSSSGSGDGSFDPFAFFFTIAIIVVVYIVIYKSSKKAAEAVKQKRIKMSNDLALAAADNATWNEGALDTNAKDIFVQYQHDWSSFNVDSMKTYMTPGYYQHNLLMMGALKIAHRQNDVQVPTVTGVQVQGFRDDIDDAQDTYSAKISYHVRDVLTDTLENKELFSKDLYGTEYYKFHRSDKKWLFSGIDQETANPALLNTQLRSFAESNGYFYSLDWGHLLLPRRGILFKTGSFGVSDINNHVIGLYKDIIVQMYTYIPTPNQATLSYLVTQTSVPKSYGDIVVRRKEGIFGGGIKGLEKLQTEWGDFNSKYEVFASNEELATSFELLNPRFMQQLQELPFEINIEVVDTIVYLYTRELGIVNPDHYETMLEILKAAFKEMRM